MSENIPLDMCTAKIQISQLHNLCSLIRIFTGHIWIVKDAKFHQEDSEDLNQTARMRRLIESLLLAHMSEDMFSHVAVHIT